MTFDYGKILNWELKRGSHQFPGPNGGTCINEAAIVASGFAYKPVKSWRDCPPCFSPVLAAFAIAVNDFLPDNQRHILMPLVTRLAGSADDEWAEEVRLKFLVDQMLKQDFDRIVEIAKNWEPKQASRAQDCLQEVRRGLMMDPPRRPHLGDLAHHLGMALACADSALKYHPVRLPVYQLLNWSSISDFQDACEIQYAEYHSGTLPAAMAEALSKAFQIGKRAPEDDVAKIETVSRRMTKAREEAPTP